MLSSEEFGEFDVFKSCLERIIQRMMSEFETIAKDEDLKGKWKISEIDGDGIKGYSLQGRFEPSQPWEPFDPFHPFEPMNPVRPLPKPQRPFARVPQSALKETSEPLADVFDDGKTIKVYFEVRGENAKDIQLNVTADKVEVKAKNFYKTINLPTSNIDLEKASSKCKNGVLEVEIPKMEKTLEKDIHKIDVD
jgi:HSP20 family molecular chaperone IbpA